MPLNVTKQIQRITFVQQWGRLKILELILKARTNSETCRLLQFPIINDPFETHTTFYQLPKKLKDRKTTQTFKGPPNWFSSLTLFLQTNRYKLPPQIATEYLKRFQIHSHLRLNGFRPQKTTIRSHRNFKILSKLSQLSSTFLRNFDQNNSKLISELWLARVLVLGPYLIFSQTLISYGL